MWCGAQVVTLIRLKKISCVHVQYDCEGLGGRSWPEEVTSGRAGIRGGVAGTVTYNLYISLLFELILNMLSMHLF